MKQIVYIFTLVLIMVLLNTANAAVNIVVSESGSDVIFTSSGTINTAVCSSRQSGWILLPGDVGLRASTAEIGFGRVGDLVDLCVTYITGVTSLGSVPAFAGASGVTPAFFIYPNGFWGPPGFTSSTSFANTMTFTGKTIASMGLAPGTYVFTLTNGAASDFITIYIPNTAPVSISTIPTLSEWAMIFMASFIAMFAARRLRRR